MQFSVVKFKGLNTEFRIDAEYHRAEILDNICLLDKKNNDVLENLVSFVVGPFGSTVKAEDYVSKSEYRYIRNKDINDFVIGDSEPALIPESVYKKLPQFHIKENDLLMTVVGTLGKVAIVQEKDSKSIFSCKSTLIKSKKIDPFYLLAYLNSKIGQLFSLRGVRGAIQQGLNLSDLKKIKVFVPSNNFQINIRKIVCESFSFSSKGNENYSQAEQLLLSELNLLNWQPEHKFSYIKTFSDTKEAGRIDAEYFQPKYEEIIRAVENYKNGFDMIGNQFKQNKKNFKKITDKEYNYIEISSINISDGSMLPTILKGEELPANAKIKLYKNDIVISKVRPYRGAIGIVNNDDYVGSGAFVVLQEKMEINKETLFVFLRLKPMLSYSLKFNTGTSYPVIIDDDVLNFPIPLFEENIQNIVKENISKSYKLRYQSKQLLEIAKKGVETAIEQTEQHAQKWINAEVRKLGVRL